MDWEAAALAAALSAAAVAALALMMGLAHWVIARSVLWTHM